MSIGNKCKPQTEVSGMSTDFEGSEVFLMSLSHLTITILYLATLYWKNQVV